MIVSALKTPGVYVNEVSIFPPSVAQVPTAIPAFIGYTEIAQESTGESLFMKYKKISSMVEYVQYFGFGPDLEFNTTTNAIELDGTNQVIKAVNKQQYYLFDSMQLFFANGGGDCYIIAVEAYRGDGIVNLGSVAPLAGMLGGLEVLKEVDEPTMIVFPDAVSMGTDMYTLQQVALQQCADLMDQVGVFDIQKAEDKTEHATKVKEFRDNIGMANLKYGAVYSPWLKVGIKKDVHYKDIKGKIVLAGTNTPIILSSLVKNLSVADTAAINNQITLLDEVVSDNQFIAKRISDILKTTNGGFANYTPAGTVIDLPSLPLGFDILVQSVNNLIAAAEANPSTANVDAAAAEVVKMTNQIYNLLLLLDDFGLKDLLFMLNQKMVDNVLMSIGFTTPFPAFPANAVGDFLAKMTEVVQWDATFSNVNPAKAIADTPAAPAQNALPILGMIFSIFNLPAPTMVSVNVALLAIPAPAALPATDLIVNQKAAIPKLQVLFNYFYNIIASIETFGKALEKAAEEELKRIWPIFKNIVYGVNNNLTILPPSGAMAGIYARVDNERGVWKAPANVSIIYAKGTLVNITDKIQEGLNIDVDAGKSVNAIRSFSGKGVLVWGARTLAGNDNEWRYVPVRRFFNMVEESVKKSTFWAVFEPNDANTWVKVKSMIENYLTLLWRQGALAGSKPEEAFFVEIGLNKTMTFVDILEGRMIVKIGMAAVRPAEFIILEFSHKVQTS
ncbi:MAG: phage tail sheath C-terminal domain-containing protein [Saprospiraceae bacterium]|nr:phage tail sheath C-terminal domain-containing protein [Saprospiraceae bacterium]